MKNESSKQFRLGIFLLSGTLILLLAMYFIGLRKNLFGDTLKIVAVFHNVNGLQPGNTVRFSGTDAGTVESVTVVNDTSVEVVIILQEAYRGFIKEDALASIGTDGLMGNKLVNIINVPGSVSALVQNGSRINSVRPVETDEMLRTLNQTNEYVAAIALNLKNITDKISNSKGTVWKLLSDTTLSGRVDSTFLSFQVAANNVKLLSSDLKSFGIDLRSGKGLVGTLTRDTILGMKLHDVVNSLNKAGSQTLAVTNELMRFTNDIDQGKGNLGFILRDSSMSGDIKAAVINIRESSESLIKALDALKRSPLLRKYIEEEEDKDGRRKD